MRGASRTRWCDSATRRKRQGEDRGDLAHELIFPACELVVDLILQLLHCHVLDLDHSDTHAHTLIHMHASAHSQSK
jgi:hypothetical protein